MQFVFACPECASEAKIVLDEEEVESIKAGIREKGRSPTLISRCSKGHELLVTLYFRDDELGIRDVIMPLGKAGTKKEKKKEIDWLRDAFGGG
ncbi:MAG: hypothetical protein ACTSUB_04960 [Candidatus Thorarchaeota archaeon]